MLALPAHNKMNILLNVLVAQHSDNLEAAIGMLEIVGKSGIKPLYVKHNNI